MKTAPSRVLYMRCSSSGVCWGLEEAKGICSHANPMTHLKSHSWAPSVRQGFFNHTRDGRVYRADKTRIFHHFADDAQVYISPWFVFYINIWMFFSFFDDVEIFLRLKVIKLNCQNDEIKPVSCFNTILYSDTNIVFAILTVCTIVILSLC